MWKTIKEYWQILLGFLVAVLGALVLTNKKDEKTKSKLNNLNRKDNKKLNKIAKERNKKIEETLDKHAHVMESIREEEKKEAQKNKEILKNHKDNLNKKSNEELADLFNKE